MDTFFVGQHPEKFIQRVLKINASTKSLVETLCDFKIYAISVLSFTGSVCAPDKATLKAEGHALQCTTAGPYNAIPSNLIGVGSVCGLGPDLVASTPSTLRLAIELLHVRPHLDKALRKSKRLEGVIALLFSLFLLSGRKNSLHPPWPVAPRTLSILFVAWTMMANLTKLRRIRSRKLPQDYSVTIHVQDFAGPISVGASKVLGPISRYRVADILPHMKLVSRASRPGLTVTHSLQWTMHGSKISH